ncbi:hypothetical protein [Phormidium sp. CCY1219]|uniref:hypothetical protein n=1 Tax=Phormidium sp. CCY1219 TaxID=2886104 RepID=UPI002D1F5D07|nr:hypothetical protein [Phormidium sp. CCY1219]MEB3829907.1 hypothetical protein [Phormidium sp. CCY1219]
MGSRGVFAAPVRVLPRPLGLGAIALPVRENLPGGSDRRGIGIDLDRRSLVGVLGDKRSRRLLDLPQAG